MKHLESLAIKELKKRIKQREKEIKTIIEFVIIITRERGKITKIGEGHRNTPIARELRGFASFSFYFSMRETTMGGNIFKVWYHPQNPWNKDFDIETNTPVFSVRYQINVNECKVDIFHSTTTWLSVLKKVIAEKDEIIKKMEEKEKKQRRNCINQTLKESERKILLKRALELKLVEVAK